MRRSILVQTFTKIMLVKNGKSLDEIVAAKPLAELDEKWGKGFMKPDSFLKVVYGGIKKFGI